MGLKISVVPRYYAYWTSQPRLLSLLPKIFSTLPLLQDTVQPLQQAHPDLGSISLPGAIHYSTSHPHGLQFLGLKAVLSTHHARWCHHALALSPQPQTIFLSSSTYQLLAQTSLSTVAFLSPPGWNYGSFFCTPVPLYISIIVTLIHPVSCQIYPILTCTSFMALHF